MSIEPLLHVVEAPADTHGEFLLPQLSVKLKEDNVGVRKYSRQATWITQVGQERLLNPCGVILRRGLQPKLLSLSMALGVTLGLFPVCGITVLLCAVAAVILQSNCHVPTLMLSNIAVAPFQLMTTFMRVGELVTRADHSPFPPDGFWVALRGQESRALLINGMLHVVIGWCLFAPFSVALLFIVSLPIFHFSLTRCFPNRAPEVPQLPC